LKASDIGIHFCPGAAVGSAAARVAKDGGQTSEVVEDGDV
jgi:hypothetical protein